MGLSVCRRNYHCHRRQSAAHKSKAELLEATVGILHHRIGGEVQETNKMQQRVRTAVAAPLSLPAITT